MSPLISIVIPAKNEEADLPSALQSIATQNIDLSTVEVIVVDGDSTDSTVQVANSFLERLALRGHGVISNPGGNTPSNLNVGLAAAQGEYLVRVDARSQIPPDYVQQTVQVLQTRPDIAVVGGSQVASARDGSLRSKVIEAALNNPWGMGGSRYRRAGASSGFADTVYLGVFRTSELRAVGGWDESFSTNQDFDLNQRMTVHGRVWFEDGLPVLYLPRRSIGQLLFQYHRFGRWKDVYWRRTHNRPQRRQMILLLAPPLAAAVALALLVVLGFVWFLPLCVVALLLASLLSRVSPLTWLVNVGIGLAWWTGVVRSTVQHTVTRRNV